MTEKLVLLQLLLIKSDVIFSSASEWRNTVYRRQQGDVEDMSSVS